MDQLRRFLPSESKLIDAFVDRGYKGHGVTEIDVYMDQALKKNETKFFRKWLKRRAAIEPLIGHMKNDGGRRRNHLLGKQGDQINALLMGIGFNMRKILKSFFAEFIKLFVTRILDLRQVDAVELSINASYAGRKISPFSGPSN